MFPGRYPGDSFLSQCSPPIRNVSQCYRHYQYLGLRALGVDLYKMLNDCASWTGEKRAAGVNKTRSSMRRERGKTKRYRQHGLNHKQISFFFFFFFVCVSVKLNSYSSVSSQELDGLYVFIQINYVLWTLITLSIIVFFIMFMSYS